MIRRLPDHVFLLLSALSWLFTTGFVQAAEAKPTLALLPSGDERAAKIVALADVELSRNDKLELLDRANVTKVLGEHKLALAGLLATDDALMAGQLLQCDIFAELNFSTAAGRAGAAVTSLVVFDAVTGARLCDMVVPVPDEAQIDKAAEAAIKALLVALKKWRGDSAAEIYRTVSLVSVRNVNLSPSLAHLPDIIGPLLERQLLQSPHVSVLERKRLAHVNKEAGISEDRRKRLLASSLMLDLDVSKKDQKGEISIRASMTSPGGAEIAAVVQEGDASEIIGILQKLTGRIVAALRLSTVSFESTIHRLEADRLFDEARRMKERGATEKRIVELEEAALALAEAALLCEPHDVQNQERVSMLERRRFTRLMKEERYDEAYAVFCRDLKQCEGWSLKTNRRRRPTAHGDDNATLYYGSKTMYEALYKVRDSLSVANAETFRQFRRTMEKWWKEYSLSRSYFDYGIYIDQQSQFWTETPEERVSELRYSRWFPWSDYYVRTARRTPCTDLFRSLTPEGRRLLLSHLDRWSRSKIRPAGGHWWSIVDGRRMSSYLQIAELAYTFPDAFENPNAVVSSNIHAALDFVLAQPQAVQMRVAPATLNSFNLPKEETIPAVIAVVERLEGSGHNGIDLLLWLDAQAQSARSTKVTEVRNQETSTEGKVPYMEPEEGYYLWRAWEQARDSRMKWHREQEDREKVKVSLNNLYRARYKCDLPGYGAEKLPLIDPWTKKELWFVTPSTNKMWIQAASVEGDTLYTVLQRTSPGYGYEVHAVNMRSGAKRKIGATEAHQALSGPIHAGNHYVHLPTGNGVLSFPLDGSTVKVWTEANGLPSLEIQSCAEVDGILYVGATANGEGCMAAVRLDGKGSEILAASGRKEKKSDLDDRTPFRIVNMVYDKAGRRLLLNVKGREGRPVLAGGEPIADYYDFRVWAYDLVANSISRVPVRKSTSRVVGRNQEKVTGFIGGEHAGDGPRLLPDGRWAYNEHLFMVFDNALTEEKRFVGPVLPAWAYQPVFAANAWDGASLAATIPWDDHTLFLGNRAGWKVFTLKDGKMLGANLPIMGDSYPFFLWVYEHKLIACTRQGAWALEVGPLPEEKMKTP